MKYFSAINPKGNMLIWLMICVSHYAISQNESIKNGPLWHDTNGNDIQAHGSGITKHGNTFYMIGEDRSAVYAFKAG